MRILVARYRSGEEFLAHYQAEFANGGLFFPTRRVIRAGESVVVDVRMPALKDYALVRGVVAWHRRGRRSDGTRAGLGIEFISAENSKRDFLLSLARGVDSSAAAQRRHRRLPTDLAVGWRIPNEQDHHESRVDDISPGGLFLRTSELPPEGTAVLLELVPPGSTAPQLIEGRVAWTSKRPGGEGLGVEFRCRDIGGMRRLRELVKRIERAEVA